MLTIDEKNQVSSVQVKMGKAEWEKEYGTKDINEIKQKLDEMNNDLKASEERMEKLYNDLVNAYDWESL